MISAMPCSKKRGKNQGTKIILEASRKTMPQIEKPDDLQLFANHPVFCVCMTIACYDGNKKKVDDTLTAMQSMRSVEPSAEILIKQY
jgi:hypothetical protein